DAAAGGAGGDRGPRPLDALEADHMPPVSGAIFVRERTPARRGLPARRGRRTVVTECDGHRVRSPRLGTRTRWRALVGRVGSYRAMSSAMVCACPFNCR